MANTTTQFVIIRRADSQQSIPEETWTPIGWDTLTAGIGRTWGWSSSGVSIPETGIYMVIFQSSLVSLNAVSLKIGISVDTTLVNGAVVAVTNPNTAAAEPVPSALTVLSLTKGAVVTGEMWFSYPTNNNDQNTSNFSIFYPTLQVIRC